MASAMTFVVFPTPLEIGVFTPPVLLTLDEQKNVLYKPEEHIREIPVEINPEYMKFVIGTQGYYFNAITKASNTSYIWYDKENAVIKVWGPVGNLDDAEKRLRDRMDDIEWKCLCDSVDTAKWSDED